MGTPGACWCNTAFICPAYGPSNPKSVKRTIISGYRTPLSPWQGIHFSRAFVAREDVWHRETACFGLANEKRRAADQRAIVDLSHEEVSDVSTTDNAEPPILWLV